ncbi:MAG: VOC family protein [Acidobacteriota bacterium]|nr:VOC family protein [Acidobacteriota bacterium]
MANDLPRSLGVSHVGLAADDPAVLAEFYRDVLGMEDVGSSTADSPFGASAFLSSRPADESHEIVFFGNAALAHTAIRTATLEDLRTFYRRVVDRGIEILSALNHGVSLAFYFRDPEGHMLEIYWATGLAFGQPYGHPIDLELPAADLYANIAALAERESLDWSPPA